MILPCLDNKPPDWFPPGSAAQENGLLCYGGELTSARILMAYSRGIFPCPLPRMPMLWWCTNPRMVLVPAQIHTGRTLTKELRRHPWRISSDSCCDKIITTCASNRRNGSWITEEIHAAYIELHRQGYVHSVEVWTDDQLVGGLYGMALGRVFFGESIFTHKPNAGKVALLALARMLAEQGYALIDCQMQSPLLASMGARNIARHRFERLLVTNGATTLAPGTWQAGPIRLTPTF